MAKCYAEATGIDKGRAKVVHRLGSVAASAVVKTWHTRVHSNVQADGRVRVRVSRNGKTLHTYRLEEREEG